MRPPAVAGAFYPGDPEELTRVVDGYLAAAQVPAIDGAIRAIMVPHAGYVYSGGVAAYAFKTLIGRSYKTVVLIGNSHKEGFFGASVFASGTFRTPLGDVDVDSEFARRLIEASELVVVRDSAHLPEHSLEVEVPFLQRTLKNFKLVPILLGAEETELSREIAGALTRVAGPDTLIVTSTDLSHYPSYKDATFADLKTLEAVCSGDVGVLERTLRQMEAMRIRGVATLMCGEGAVKTVMFYAKDVGATDIRLLKYANSGDAKPSMGGVVGYGAVVFAAPAKPAESGDEVLNAAEQKELLALARSTVEAYIRTRKVPPYENKTPAFDQHLGAFVTLKKHGELRGCIGRFEPNIPIWRVVQQMAIAAATEDGRFPPVSEKELAELEYEISVLSPLRKAASWKEIELGRHGVQVQRGFRRGVFLPQVATETGWDLDTFMGNLCAHKAGLPPDAWKDPGTDLYLFTAQVFHE